MCLETRQLTVEVCKESRLVYKSLFYHPNGKAYSLFRGHCYRHGVQQTVEMDIQPDEDFTRVKWVHVHRAYHSWKRPNVETNALFLIPKGALYFDGWQSNWMGYASNTIVYLGKRYRLMTYLRLLYYKLKFR